MADFKHLIRPFQAVDVTYPRRIFKSDETPPANVVYKVGGPGGGIKTLAYSHSYSMTAYMEQKREEVETPPDQLPDGRKRHVKRFPGKTRKNGVVTKVPDTWIDVERIEEITTEEGSGYDYQKTKAKFKWYLDDAGNEPNPMRKTTTVTVVPTDADGNPGDPDELFFEIEVNDEMVVVDDDQRFNLRFDNTIDNDRRRDASEVRRIKHFDTPYDDDPKYDDGGIIRNYEKTPDTKDDDQFLDVEILGSFAHDYHRVQKHGFQFEHWQRREFKLNNDYLIAGSYEPEKSYGGEINPPYRFDPVQNIVNVKLLTDVIVVFVDAFGIARSTFNVIDEKAEMLEQFNISYVNPGAVDAFGTAYRVSSNAGVFIRSTLPNVGIPATVISVLVFAITGGIDASLQRAVEGTALALTGYGLIGAPAGTGLPGNIAPPGLLWFAGFSGLSGMTLSWKMRSGNHRNDESPTPPNKMVQCYALPASYSVSGKSVFGYTLITYRLDRKGTEAAYGADLSNVHWLENINAVMDPAWFQPISTAGDRGIPYGDPPPLISADRPNN